MTTPEAITTLALTYQAAFQSAMDDPHSKELAAAKANARMDLFDALEERRKQGAKPT